MNRFTKYIKGFLVICLFFFSSLLDIIPIKLFGITELTDATGIFISLCRNIMLAFLLFLIYRKELINEFQTWKENAMKHIDTGFKYWILGLAGMMISNIIIQMFFKQSTAGNEEAVQGMIQTLPMIMLINTGILAPITEEICFRKTFYDAIKNKWIFIFVSGIFFGALHVVFSITNPFDLLYIIPYSMLGIAFAIMYQKTESVFTSMSMHAIHNSILTLLSIVSYMYLILQ